MKEITVNSHPLCDCFCYGVSPLDGWWSKGRDEQDNASNASKLAELEALSLLASASMDARAEEYLLPTRDATPLIEGGAAHPEPSKGKLQAGACTLASSSKRQGRGAVNKDRSSREADRRLRGVYRAEARVWEEWCDGGFSPTQEDLLKEGCPDTGLGPCRCDPTVFLELRALLLLAQRGAEGGLYSPAR